MKSIENVEAHNDSLAREHDIDAYYASSSLPIRLIEQQRLRIIRAMVGDHSGARILEVGCGGGHVLSCYPDGKLTGLDVSAVMLDKARRRLAGYDVTLIKGELDKAGLEDGSFDVAICTEVLEHVVDPQGVLEQMRRVLCPGGRAVVTFPNDRLINSVKAAVRTGRLDRLPLLSSMAWGGDDYHLHVWSIPQMGELLSRYFTVHQRRFAPSRLLPVRCCFSCSR